MQWNPANINILQTYPAPINPTSKHILYLFITLISSKNICIQIVEFFTSLGAISKWKLLTCVQLFATPWTVHPWNSPSQNTGVGSLSLLQGIFPTQGLNPGLLYCRQILYQLSHKGSMKDTYCSPQFQKQQNKDFFLRLKRLKKKKTCFKFFVFWHVTS